MSTAELALTLEAVPFEAFWAKRGMKVPAALVKRWLGGDRHSNNGGDRHSNNSYR
jgi:hypothetical protein